MGKEEGDEKEDADASFLQDNEKKGDDKEEGERRPRRPDGPRPDGPRPDGPRPDGPRPDGPEEKDDEKEGDDEEDPFDVKDIMKMSKLVRNALAQMRKTIERFGKIVGNLKNDGNEKRTQRIHALRSHLMALKHNFEINAADAHKRVAGLKATVELAFKQAQERYGQLEKMTVHFKNALREFHHEEDKREKEGKREKGKGLVPPKKPVIPKKPEEKAH